MNNDKFQFLLIGQQRDDDSDFSDNEYNNKDFKIQKYEKFKPKKNDYKKDLRGAENQIKNILSVFLKNIESEKKDSNIIFTGEQSHKNKERNSISNRNKKIMIMKTSTFNKDKDFTRSSSLNFPVKNYFLNNNLSKTPEISNLNPNLNHKKKVAFNLNPNDISNNSAQKENSYLTRKRTKNKNNSLIKNNEIKVSRTLKFKEKINDFVKRTKSIGSGIFKSKKKNSKEIKGDLINSKQNGSKNYNLNNTGSLIKKTNSFIQNNNNSYYNFKNDNYILNKSNNDNSNNLRHSLRKKKIKNTKKNKIDLFNDSTHNSIISDCSECALNKKSIDIKSLHNDSYIKEYRNSVMGTSSLINKNLSTLLSKRGSNDFTEVSFKNSGNKSSIRPKKVSDFKKSIEIKKNEANELKKWGTSVKDNQLTGNSKLRRLNTYFKSLKEQLKQSLVLRPEELDLSFDEKNDNAINKNLGRKKLVRKDKSSKFKKMSSFNYSFHNNMKIVKKNEGSKSNNNLLKISPSFSNSNLDTKKNNSNENIQVVNPPLVSEDKPDELNIENQNTLDTKKSTFEEFSQNNSIKRKNTIYYEKYRVLTHKASVYDSLDDEEFDDQEEINNIYIDPNSTFSITFDSILFVFSILSLLQVPFYLAIEKNFCRKKSITLTFFVNILIELINIIDLFLGFFRAFYNWDEQLINKNKIIIRKYLSGWFLFDLLSSIPVYLITKIYEPICSENELFSNYYNIVLNKPQYLLISNRLFKTLKVFNYNQAWKITSNKLNVYGRIIMYVFLVFAIFNYTTCLYIFIARNSYPNWILHTNLETHPFKDIYICSIYILTMAITTVGYGDITCYSLSERIFQLFLLVIGIIAYSWVVSFISNNIKKINERSADYENRKSILDEIKRSHPNLQDELYDRILRYLKFKNFHEKKLKNIIFDCLPVGLKNNLISEMYKPIIQNFIFFKNFQNTDFIVRVILSFKPILAYKNDILVNEGDLVEDIMFVKKGMLTVELPINMADPQENIDKYLNASIISKNNDKESQNLKNMLANHDKDLKKNNSLYNAPSFLSYTNSMKNTASFNPIQTQIEREREEREEKELQRKKNTTYVKILGIRENEHFGDVLMFLEQRSPLRVRVRSKKSELFFLKKMDAIKISASFQNIWRRINKKSVFNFEQMKKSIKNIVQVYCSVKKCKDKDEGISEEPSYLLGLNNKSKLYKKDYLNNSALKTIKEESNLRKTQSQKIERINYKNFFKNIDIDDSDLIIDNTDDEKKICISDTNDRNIRRKIKLSSSIKKALALSSSSSESSVSPPSLDSSVNNSKSMSLSNFTSGFKKSIIKQKNETNNNKENHQKFGQKVLDVFNGNYKFYKGYNQNYNDQQVTIITEQPDQEGTIHPLNYTNSIKKLTKISTLKKNKILNTITAKKSYYEEMPNCISENEDEDSESDIENKSIKSRIFTSKSMKKKLPSYNFNKKSKFDIIDRNDDNESDTYFENTVNKEIYPGEVIEVSKEENLLKKKIKLVSPTEENSELNNSLENKNTRLQLILRTIEDENENKTVKDKNDYNNYDSIINEEQSSISGVGLNKFNSNRKLNSRKNNQESNRYLVSSLNQNEEKEKSKWNINILAIHYNISFHYNSSYENFNLISGGKLIKNKTLQNKMKNYLLEEMQNLQNEPNIEANESIIKKTNSFAGNIKYQAGRNLLSTTIGQDKRRATSIIFNQNNNFHLTYKKTRKKIRKTKSSMQRRSKTANSLSELLNKSNISTNDKNNDNINNKEKPKKSNNKFQTGIGNDLFNGLNSGMAKRRFTCYKDIMVNNGNNHLNNNIGNSNINNLIRPKSRKSGNVILTTTTLVKSKKKKDNLLSQINLNIKKTNQNLNNPEEFYSNYFTSLLEGELNKKSQKNVLLFGKPMADMTKVKKEKEKEKFSKIKGTIIK